MVNMHLVEGESRSPSLIGPGRVGTAKGSVETAPGQSSSSDKPSTAASQATLVTAQLSGDWSDERLIDVLLLTWVVLLYRYTGLTEGYFCLGKQPITSNDLISTWIHKSTIKGFQLERSDSIHKVFELVRELRRQLLSDEETKNVDAQGILFSNGVLVPEDGSRSDTLDSEVRLSPTTFL